MRGVGDCDASRGAGGGGVMLSELNVGMDGYSGTWWMLFSTLGLDVYQCLSFRVRFVRMGFDG